MAAKKTAKKVTARSSQPQSAKPSAPVKAAKPSAPVKAAKPTKSAPVKAAKPSAPVKAAKPTKSAPVKAAKPSAPVKPAKPSAPEAIAKPSAAKPSLKETVKRAAAKVVQAAAAAAIKVLDSDAGRKAPSFELSDENGKAVSSSSLAGKPYLLYFYPKDDTPGCTKEACDIRDSFARFGKQGLRVLGVSPDSAQSHGKFIKKYGLPFTLLSDPDKTLASSYGVWAEKSNYGKKYMGIVRSSFLVGADGLIKKSYRAVRVNGHVDAVLEDAKAML